MKLSGESSGNDEGVSILLKAVIPLTVLVFPIQSKSIGAKRQMKKEKQFRKYKGSNTGKQSVSI